MEALLYQIESLGAEAFSHFWLPMTLWTVAALPLYGLLRAWKGLHPLTGYTARAALLLALPVGLLLSPLTDAGALAGWHVAPGLAAGAAAAGTPAGTATGAEAAGFPLALVSGLLFAGAVVGAALRLVRLGLDAWSLRRLGATFARTAPPAVRARADRLCAALGLHRPLRLVVSAEAAVPFTYGWRRPTVVLPEALLEDPEALDLALAHELVHARRGDYALQWVEQLTGAAFAVHPFVAVLRKAVAGYREMACDAEVLARTRCSRQRYANLLFRFVVPTPVSTAMTVGMAASADDLKSRLRAMKAYPARQAPRAPARAAAALLLALCLAAVACTDLVDINIQVPAPAPAETGPARVAGEDGLVMPSLEGGLAALQREIRYPTVARDAGIEGRVLVQFTVDEKGAVADARVVKGIGGGCDEEAVRALEAMRFEPGRQDGRPVAARMTIPITFRL